MKKRMISLCLSLALLLCLLPAAPTAAAAGEVAINETNFPDQNFRAFISEELDQNSDGVLSQDEIADAAEIYCSSRDIASLKGIAYFTQLTRLDCDYNQLTALDVSQNPVLNELHCSGNQLTSLDVSRNARLTKLICTGSQLTSLNVTGCAELNTLYCTSNQLTSLNVSGNSKLAELHCDFNQLTALDVSRNGMLMILNCAGNQLTSLDASRNTRLTDLTCYENQLTSLNVSGCTALESLYCEENQLTALDVSRNTALTNLYCTENRLTALDVSRNTALQWLSCGRNQLTALDVSKNTKLVDLSCDGNQLTTLNVSRNAALTSLNCGGNRLTALDVSKNTSLSWLYCFDNQLTALNVSKNTILNGLSCFGNRLTALDLSRNQELWYLACYGNHLTELDVSAVPGLLDALKNGTKTYQAETGAIEFETVDSLIEMDLGQKTVPASNPFLDVTADDFFNDAVSWAYQNDVASGTSKTKFNPFKTCNREQVVTFLWRAKGCQEPTNTVIPFVDVPADAYYTKAVLWAVENGITNGKSRTKFGVGDPCTRGQVVTFLWRAEGEPEPTSAANPFKDVSETDYFYKAVLWAVENGITNGTSKTKFSPTKTCTRGQVVTFLYRDAVGAE